MHASGKILQIFARFLHFEDWPIQVSYYAVYMHISLQNFTENGYLGNIVCKAVRLMFMRKVLSDRVCFLYGCSTLFSLTKD